jgi:hypothetical protein
MRTQLTAIAKMPAMRAISASRNIGVEPLITYQDNASDGAAMRLSQPPSIVYSLI